MKQDQKIFEFKCPLEKEFKKFITHVDDPDKVVCCSCPYTMWKKDGITREEIKRRERNLKNSNSKAFYEHLLSIQSK